MNLTKRSHYNPCFWTAHWNSAFLDDVLTMRATTAVARAQKVAVLNVRSNRLFEASVETVHVDKGLGTAEITPDMAIDYCRRHFPDELERFRADMQKHPETLVLDCEGILSIFESTDAYKALLRTIRQQGIRNAREKAQLAAFIAIHNLRSHAVLNSMLEWSEKLGEHKFEHFVALKHLLGNPKQLYAITMSIVPGSWKFYRLRLDTFPLCDSPILITPESVMVALSPRLLLEIDRTRHDQPDSYTVGNVIRDRKLQEFRTKTIANTFREIIFSNVATLKDWQETAEFQQRHAIMKDQKTYNAVVRREGARELWCLNRFANSASLAQDSSTLDVNPSCRER